MQNLVNSIRSELPAVKFLSYSMASPSLVRVVADINHVDDSRTNKGKILSGFTAAAKSKLKPIVGSFISLQSSEFGERLMGVMGINREVVPYTKDNSSDFHMYAKNMFMDSEQNIWNLKKTESGDLLIKTNQVDDEESLKDLMESLSNNRINSFESTSSGANNVVHRASAGDYVLYVSPKTHRTESGFLVSEIVGGKKYEDFFVLASADADEEIISRDSVIDDFDVDEDDLEDMSKDQQMSSIYASAKGNSSLTDILSYYKSLYVRNPAYFEEFKRRLRSHCFV